jgi:hypothetical protein
MTIISKKFKKGIILQGESSDSSENEEGSLFHNSSDGRIKSYVEGAVRQIVTNSQSQVLTNKILSGPNIEVQNPFRLDVKKDTKAALQSYASSASNGQLCFAIDSKQMFQVIDGVLKSVGGGGADNVSSLLIQTFDEVEASDFVQTGLVIVGTDTINGERSARLIHQVGTSPANDQSFKQTITVDRKFRGNSMQLSLAIQSTAAQGNVTLKVYDETNSANIIASEQITTGSQIISGLSTSSGSPVISGFNNVALNSLKVGQRVTGSGIPTDSIITAVNSSALTINIDQNATASATVSLSFSDNIARKLVNFTIPQNCASLSYTITALPESGSPETYIDDIIIELSEATLLETSVVTPNITAWQGYTPTLQGFGSPTNIEFEWRQVGENIEIRGKFIAGTTTAIEARVGLPAGSTSSDTSLIPSIQSVGHWLDGNPLVAPGLVLIEPSVNYITFGSGNGGNNSFSKLNGSAIHSSGATAFGLFASVPCSGLSATTTKTIPLTQSGLVQEDDSVLRASGNAGQVITSVVTNIPFIAQSNLGSAISWDGAIATVQKDGLYIFDGSVRTTGVNSGQIFSYINGVQFLSHSDNANAGVIVSFSGQVYLKKNDTLSFRLDSTLTLSNDASHNLTISRQGSLKQVSVNPNSKITIPTSELRFEGASTLGSTATVIVKFDTIAKLRGDAFTVESDSVLGTRITMKKAGKLDINASCSVFTNSSYLMITKNLTSLTVTPSVPSEIISASQVYATTAVTNVTGNLYVNVGDIIRIAATGVPAGDTRNVLNLSFQEQDISVSVTNTLPQFSESDSSVRVDTANGYGSTATKIRRFSNVRENIGADIEYVDSATNGASFTVKSAGIYNISYTEVTSSESSGDFGISKNASNLTTNVQSLALSEVLALGATSTSVNNQNVSWQGYLLAGDIIRPHSDATLSGVTTTFTMSKVGKPNVTGVDVTPFVNVPQPEIEAITHAANASTLLDAASEYRFALGNLSTTNKGIIRIEDDSTNTRTKFVANKRCTINLSCSASFSVVGWSLIIYKNGSLFQVGSTVSTANFTSIVSSSFTLETGEFFSIGGTNIATIDPLRLQITAEALSDQILTAPETFSTDTASLKYVVGTTDFATTVANLANASIGSYSTFLYPSGGSNSRQITSTRPTQTDADMNTNGIQLFTRAYNAASTAAQPAAIAIQIGKGLKGKSIDLYKSAGKVTAGAIDYSSLSSTAERGFTYKDYNELTGILFLDVGQSQLSSAGTSRDLVFIDQTAQSSGYLVINASKSPALTGVPLLQPRIATLSDVKASGTSGGTATSGSYQTRTLNTLSDPMGIVTSLASNQFTLPAGEYYIEGEASASFVNTHRAKLRNITDSADTLIGTSEFSSAASVYASTPSRVKGNVVISSSKVFEIQHRVETTRAVNGFGLASGFVGDSELYTIIKITKVK